MFQYKPIYAYVINKNDALKEYIVIYIYVFVIFLFMSKEGLEELEEEIIKFLDGTKSGGTLKGILEHVRNHKEIIKSKEERAKKDKIRRVLKNSDSIYHLGKTRNKRYFASLADLPDNDPRIFGCINYELIDEEIFLLNELLGGETLIHDIAEKLRSRCVEEERQSGYGYPEEYEDTFDNFGEWLHMTRYFQHEGFPKPITLVLPKAYGKPHEGEGYPFAWEIDYAPYKPNQWFGRRIVVSSPEKWFIPQGDWMQSQFFGFQGAGLLSSVMDNISKNIDSIRDDVADRSNQGTPCSNVKREIQWLKENKKSIVKRHSNKNIITLALLHLNRSLQSEIT